MKRRGELEKRAQADPVNAVRRVFALQDDQMRRRCADDRTARDLAVESDEPGQAIPQRWRLTQLVSDSRNRVYDGNIQV